MSLQVFDGEKKELNMADKRSGIENQQTLGHLKNHIVKFEEYQVNIKARIEKIFADIEDLNKKFNDSELKISDNGSKIFNNEQSISKVNKAISKLDTSKSDRAEVRAINERLDGFANIEHIDQLKNKFMPRIEKFSQEIDKFMADNESMRECILRFDMDISMKANKSDFPLFKCRLDEEFVNLDHYAKLGKRFDSF